MAYTDSIRTDRPEVFAEEERPHGCYEGFVYIGHMVEDGHGDELVFEAVPCKRCKQS